MGIFDNPPPADSQFPQLPQSLANPKGDSSLTGQTKFNAAYHLSRAPEVQRMRELNDPQRRRAVAIELAKQFSIDDSIDVTGRNAYMEMHIRWSYGYHWVPSMLQQPVNPPTLMPVPPGALLVSVNIKDFPPITPARAFSMYDYFRVKFWCDENGLYTENIDRQMVLGGDAEDCPGPEALTRVDNLPQPIFAGAIRHFGIVIGGKVWDAEQLDLRIQLGVDAVKAYMAERG